MPAQTFLVVAARNEAERIGTTLAALALAFPGAPVWVADDGSRDRTAAIARATGAQLVASARPIGKGAAVTAAARAALDQAQACAGRAGGRPVFVLCDADLAHSARNLADLAEAVGSGRADMAVAAFGERVGGGLGIAVGFARWAVRRGCGVRMTAPLSGQRALSAAALADVLPLAQGFGMEVGMTIDAVRAGHRVVELELDLAHRASGRTPAGFAHRARQLIAAARAYRARRRSPRRSA